MSSFSVRFLAFAVLTSSASASNAQTPDLGGVQLSLQGYQGPATIQAQRLEGFKVSAVVNAKGETQALTVSVELPTTGPNTWPAADVEVRDATGKALSVQRSGDEWFKLLIPLPPGTTAFVVQAVEPKGGWAKPTSDKERAIEDATSGLRLRIAKWYDGRAAALSIRFDDSRPTHLTKAAPILHGYGFRGTFMINPGAAEPGTRRTSDFEEHRAEWEALAQENRIELANHSSHHRGGKGDEDMEAEIGDAAKAIWKMTPNKSHLMALNLGGGTRWETTRPLSYYLDRYQQFDASANSTGMDDRYGQRVENFRRSLKQHIQRGLWCRIHYHYIGPGLGSSEANFRAALDIAKEHSNSLWIAGLADIHKYQTERNTVKLKLLQSTAQHLQFQITLATDATLYDQPLTVEVSLPPAWHGQKVSIKGAKGVPIPTRVGKAEGLDVLRFDAPPNDGAYSISTNP